MLSNMDISIENLQSWLDNLNRIPKKRLRQETLLDIAGIGHLENHWSYIYIYFFNTKGSHGMSRLFIDSLQSIIREKTGKPELAMNSFSVLREDTVPDEDGNKKRIDILLQNDTEAIIIENKVYAQLYNRLDLYWGKPNVPVENKRGVILSLRPTSSTHKGFINITHEEFANAIEKRLPAYFMSAQPKALILLQDFIQNIHNISHPMNEEELSFYFQEVNRRKINRLAEIRNNIIDHIKQAVENEGLDDEFKKNNLELKVLKRTNKRYVYYAFEANENVMLTLVYDSLWNYSSRCRIRMFLELQGEMIGFVKERNSELQTIGIVADANLAENNSYRHYMTDDIFFNPAEDLADNAVIADKIVSGIKESRVYNAGLEIVRLWRKYQTSIK